MVFLYIFFFSVKFKVFNFRNNNFTTNLQTAINISTEELVTVEVTSDFRLINVMFNPCETFYLVIIYGIFIIVEFLTPVVQMIFMATVSL